MQTLLRLRTKLVLLPLCVAALSAACSSSATPDSGADVITPADGGADVVTTDAPGMDVTGTDSSADVPAPNDVTGTDAAGDVPGTDVARTDAASDVPRTDAATCAFDQSYRYGNTGGRVAFTDSTALAPATMWTRTRTPASGTPTSCMQSVPCGTSGLLDVTAVMQAIGHADVQAALTSGTSPLFGRDTRPVDGSVFVFTRTNDGHDFVVGTDCAGAAGCTPIPAGIALLVTMLRNLDTQELAMAGCEALR